MTLDVIIILIVGVAIGAAGGWFAGSRPAADLRQRLAASEEEARGRVAELVARRQWPCYFFASDTTGEKDFEEFYTERETLDLARFTSIGVIKNEPVFDPAKLTLFLERINELKARGLWTREELVDLFHAMIPEFGHKERGKFLDEKM